MESVLQEKGVLRFVPWRPRRRAVEARGLGRPRKDADAAAPGSVGEPSALINAQDMTTASAANEISPRERRGFPDQISISIGGGTTCGEAGRKRLFRPGLNFRAAGASPIESVMARFVHRAFPYILIKVEETCPSIRTAVHVTTIPSVGQGEIFRPEE
jgi:hypothetical protein